MRKFILIIFVFLLNLMTPFLGIAQDNFLQPGSMLYRLADRYEVVSGNFLTSTQMTGGMVRRKHVIALMEQMGDVNPVNAFNYHFLITDVSQGPLAATHYWHNRKSMGHSFWSHFYNSKAFLFDYADSSGMFRITMNPVLGLTWGQDKGEHARSLYRNTRGVETRGFVGKVGYYSLITENQERIPVRFDYYADSFGYLPHQTFWKKFKEDGYDYFHARGYVWRDFGKISTLRFGHDKVFWGNGLRSLIVGDAAPPALFLQHQAKMGIFDYQNYFVEMFDFRRLTGNSLLPKKYAALHRLGINLHKKLNIGFYEAIVFGRGTTNGGFDLQYLNPIIFYRSIEQNLGSSDNAMLGMDWKWNLPKRMQFYGQFVLDEFKLDELRGRTGWWANKYAGQAGWKANDILGISNLDIQVEYNAVRPFTYSHFTSEGSWAHYGQSMAHPMGANFREGIVMLTAQPLPRLRLQTTFISFVKGEDSTINGANYGGNILRDYSKRAKEYDNYIGQGKEIKGRIFQLNVGWMLAHNLVVEANGYVRTTRSNDPIQNPLTRSLTLGFRWNLAAEHHLMLF